MIQRRRAVVTGKVQGVGFRPWFAVQAREANFSGWVRNASNSVELEIEGPGAADWLSRKLEEARAPIEVRQYSLEPISITGESGFSILGSTEGENNGEYPKDLGLCADCAYEVRDPKNRRYEYPLIGCSECGPRFSITHSLPFDRANTTQTKFAVCSECEAEVGSTGNRRFHTQITSCWECGPQMVFRDSAKVIARGREIYAAAAESIRAGKILAVKGLTGYQLWVDATNAVAIAELRKRKCRPHKPFALLVSEEQVSTFAQPTHAEMALLRSAARPIVFVSSTSEWITDLAPGLDRLGLMLPSTAFALLLLNQLGNPLVATSGNISGEIICANFADAVGRLQGIADFYLDYDREILTPLDDSIQSSVAEKTVTYRLGRGLAPLKVEVEKTNRIAVGGDQKSAIAVGVPGGALLSQHLGEIAPGFVEENHKGIFASYSRTFQPQEIRVDAHPEFLASAVVSSERSTKVFHHEAHAWSVYAEHQHETPALAFVWDGSGYGRDRKMRGGECFEMISPQAPLSLRHSLPHWKLPGGEVAYREPRRCALGLRHFLGLPLASAAFTEAELPVLRSMLQSGFQCEEINSVGRLFDAVAGILEIAQICTYEGEAALRLEAIARETRTKEHYLGSALGWDLTWMNPLIQEWEQEKNAALCARKFHNSLIELIGRTADVYPGPALSFSGGCFQNSLLLEGAILRCPSKKTFFPQKIPLNDGGLAMGQLIACV